VSATTGSVISKKVGEMLDESRSLYECSKCGQEFQG